MALFDRISNLPLIRQFFQPQAAAPSGPAISVQRRAARDAADFFRVSTDRRSVVLDCRAMYMADPRIRESIGKLARDVTWGGFRIEVEPRAGVGRRVAKVAQVEAEALQKRLKLVGQVENWLRQSERDGDTFLVVNVDSELKITRLTRQPTLQMHRNTDREDNFIDPEVGFWQAGELWAGFGDNTPPNEAITYPVWQVIHARLMHDEGDRYGQPRFSSARQAWKLLVKGERDMGIRRAVRATMRYSHEIQNAGDLSIQRYIELNRTAADDENAAIKDFYGAKVNAIQGDANLGETGDLRWHLDTVAAASPVPFALLAGGQELNRDVLEDATNEYHQTLIGVTGWASEQLVIPIIELQWLLAGIWPDDFEVNIRWAHDEELKARLAEKAAAAATTAAKSVVEVGNAAIQLRTAGLPDNLIDEIVAGLLGQAIDNLTGEEILKRLEAYRARSRQETDPINRPEQEQTIPQERNGHYNHKEVFYYGQGY